MGKRDNGTGTDSLFAGLDEQTAARYRSRMKMLSFKPGDQITRENGDCDCVYYISRGSVEIARTHKDSGAQEMRIMTMGQGRVFGSMSALNGSRHFASAYALDEVDLLEIGKDLFLEMATAQPQVMYNLVVALSQTLGETGHSFVDLMDNSLRQNHLTAIGSAASKIMHDIKSPLTVIVLTAQLIESIFSDSAEFTESIVKQAQLVDELVRETLDFAKGNHSEPLIQKVDLDAFFKDLRDTYGPSLKSREIDILVENKCTAAVYFDESKIRRVLLNLIKNSSEAMTEPGKIRISANLASNWLQISVTDSGPGVPGNVADRLFEPFVSSGKTNGTGLGLPICQKLVEEHQGHLDYSPVKPHGSRFSLRLPQNLK